ncbi:alpha/beta fold hydrolase [Nocardia sp. NPDC005366]|uniref:thioesterase II family protein n=1 Tax=Nocardia sp. NPDC005366 TaxID=3156878 RepID=UPI0033AFFF43
MARDLFATWIRRLRGEPGASTALVCFPSAGGAAAGYRDLARHIDPAADVYAVQYPGRRERIREAPISSLTGLAARIAPALEPLLGREPALFGHSMGATVAFETARLLEAGGTTLAALYVSGRSAPSEPAGDWLPNADDATLIDEMARLANDPASIRLLREAPELAAAVLPAVRADFAAVAGYVYRPGPPLRCPVIGLTGVDDPITTPAQVGAWSAHTTGPFELHVFPGSHFYLDLVPADVAAIVNSALRLAG